MVVLILIKRTLEYNFVVEIKPFMERRSTSEIGVVESRWRRICN